MKKAGGPAGTVGNCTCQNYARKLLNLIIEISKLVISTNISIFNVSLDCFIHKQRKRFSELFYS